VDEGEFRMKYDDRASAFVEDVGEVAADAAGGGGSKEKRKGEGEMNARYWSTIYLINQRKQKTEMYAIRACSTSSDVPSCATKEANSSRSARGNGSTKLK
jgi:hypothetical protein